MWDCVAERLEGWRCGGESSGLGARWVSRGSEQRGYEQRGSERGLWPGSLSWGSDQRLWVGVLSRGSEQRLLAKAARREAPSCGSEARPASVAAYVQGVIKVNDLQFSPGPPAAKHPFKKLLPMIYYQKGLPTCPKFLQLPRIKLWCSTK